MEKRPGTFIVIEGTDGAGKSTQFELLKKRLEDAGHSVAVFKFPRVDLPSGYFVRRYLQGDYGKTDEVGPYTSSLFYALDRFEAAADIRKALEAGKVVLSDRFTGSNMAHQGTKIPHAEERRGFFIWLDNLEFEMLRIPRPDISFVLRVPAEIAVAQLANKPNRDIHENDVSHLERTVTVYDDMTQLFPKDFQRIDCVRSDQLLDADTIHSMLWEKVSPLLPLPAKVKAAIGAAAPEPPAVTQEVKQPKADESKVVEEKVETIQSFFELSDASLLLVQRVERSVPSAQVETSVEPSVYVPKSLSPEAADAYRKQTGKLIKLHAKIAQGLAVRGASPTEALTAARAVLPVALTSTIRIPSDAPELEELIGALLNDQLPEVQAAGATLMAQAIKAKADFAKTSKKPAKVTAPTAVRALAEEFLAENYAPAQESVQLFSVWPRNEIDLVPDMLYPHSSLPLRSIQEQVAGWPLNRKLAVFEAYIGDDQPGLALEKAHYSWDLLSTYDVFRELQRLPAQALEYQPFTARYGYDVPALIEDADLADAYESAFDLSLTLYSNMQKAGHQLEAQYATLQGHNQRWKVVYNAAQLFDMRYRTLAPGSRRFIAHLYEKVGETHPTLAEGLIQSPQAK